MENTEKWNKEEIYEKWKRQKRGIKERCTCVCGVRTETRKERWKREKWPRDGNTEIQKMIKGRKHRR
jgi:hypothetical protein